MASLEQVLQQGQVWQAQQHLPPQHQTISSGYTALDARLPNGGWQPGQVCEIYHQGGGVGELSIVIPALAKLSQQARWLLWVAPPAIPYAPALELAGVRSERILMVHPRSYKEAVWCMEEGLKSGHCSAVLGWLQEWDKQHIRRLQIAAADNRSHCWLWPQTGLDTSGSPAALRLEVARQQADTLQVTFHKRRGSWPCEPFNLHLSDHGYALAG